MLKVKPSTIHGGRGARRYIASLPLTFARQSIAPCLFMGLIVASLFVFPSPADAQQIDYSRPVDAAPQPDDIGENYVLPIVQQSMPRPAWREIIDLAALTGAMALGVWIVIYRRNRRETVFLTVACLLYFGLYREGCICAIGAIQNIVVALTEPHYAASYFVIGFFLLPLIAALLFGRVFCGGVCPLGAIQELVTMWPIHVPRLLDKILGSFKWIYLGLAIWFAAGPAETRDFIICRFDPFVGFFRFTGPLHMMLIGAGFLILGLFIGRPYCRYLCPYGALLSLVSRVSWRGVTITPDKELDCGLCAESCPYGAIKDLRAESGSCFYCARCYNTCPRQRVLDKNAEEASAS